MKTPDELRDFGSVERKNSIVSSGIAFIERSHENGTFPCNIAMTRDMKGETKSSPREVGSSLLMLDTTLKHFPQMPVTEDVIQYSKKSLDENGRISFFEDKNIMPADMETTAFGVAALLEAGAFDESSAHAIVDEIVRSKNLDGIIQVYFSDSQKGNRIDWVSATNIVYLLALLERESECTETVDWIFNVLRSRAYLQGSRYYEAPDAFLYFLSRLLKFENFRIRFEEFIRTEIDSRDGATLFPIDVAMRVTTSRKVGTTNSIDVARLMITQQEDGSWPSDSIYHWGRSLGYFGSSAISTGFSVEALNPKPQTNS